MFDDYSNIDEYIGNQDNDQLIDDLISESEELEDLKDDI